MYHHVKLGSKTDAGVLWVLCSILMILKRIQGSKSLYKQAFLTNMMTAQVCVIFTVLKCNPFPPFYTVITTLNVSAISIDFKNNCSAVVNVSCT
jgi:hypothetical protein